MSVPLACSSCSTRNVYGYQVEVEEEESMAMAMAKAIPMISTRQRRMISKRRIRGGLLLRVVILLLLLVVPVIPLMLGKIIMGFSSSSSSSNNNNNETTTTTLLSLCFLFGVISISRLSRIQNLNLLLHLNSPSRSTRRRPRKTFFFLTLLTMMTTSSTFTCLAVDVTFSDSQNPFLVLCTVDGQILVLDAYDGSLQGGFSSGIPLVGASSSLKDNRRIVPGLDGSLYISDNVGFLQPLTISVLDVLQSPVKTCSSQQDCGIVTATKATSLFALSSSTGQLVWHQNAQGETTTTTTTTNENDNQSQPSSPTVLLQREDVLVQQISTDSGDQVWNVTLGTFQALEFGDQELLQNSDPLLPGERLDSLDKWLALDRADQHKTPPPTASSQLPNVIFGAEGTSLTAVDPHRSGRVLWKREFGTVVASVFGLSGKSWKPLTVLEEDDDDTVEEDNTDDNIPSNPAASRKQPWAHGIPRLLSRKLLSRKHSSFQDAQAVQATGLDFYQPPPWQQVLYNYLNLERIREHIGHLFSPFEPLTKRDPCLLPGACSEKRRLVKHFAKARETDLLAGLYQRPPRLELPSAPPQDMLHTQRTPEGLFLTWRLVLAIVITLVAVGGVVFRFLYVKKKQQWLQLIARATSPALSSGSLSTGRTRSSNVSFDELGLTLSQSGTTGTTINKKLLRRTQSLPDVHDDNFVGSLDLLSSNHKLLQHANTSEGKLIKTVQEQQADANNTRAITTTAAASSSAASGESHQGVGLIDGIPLVRYSRYDSEFDETVALGKGGFGTVFRCKNALDGREYAIKKVFIRHDQGYPQEFSQRLQRVLREVKILALLDHANIVRYYTAWLELEQGVSGEKDTSVSAAASDYYMFQSTTPKNMHGQFSSEMVTSPTRSPERQQRRVSLDPWKSTDPIGWNNVINNEDSLTRMDLAPPIQWDDYGFTFDRSENNINNNNNTDGSFATSTSDNEKDADASITNDGRGDFSSHGGGMEIGENSIASESSSHKSMTTWSQEDTNTNVTCNKEPVTATPKEEETLSSHAASTLVRHTLYIQMQLCSQKTLADFLSNEEARRGSSGGDGVDIPYALSLFLQIAQGVKHVHGQGLIHRDLKPNNCFIDDTGVVKVGDFGLSRESTDKGNEATPSAPMPLGDGTDNTAGVGTRSYASPEQMSGSDYDSSTDVYSLGIMLFELCYPMYTGMERHIVFSKLRNHVFPDQWLQTVNPAFPTLHPLLLSMISNRPSNRPTAETVARSIQSILEEFTITSLDKHQHEGSILLRVEGKPREDVLRYTIELIKDAAFPDTVEIVQYGLRGGTNKTIMEFAIATPESERNGLSSPNPSLGLKLVSKLTECPDVLLIRQVSATKYT